MPFFAVRTCHGAGWEEERDIRGQRGWNAHAAFMDGLVTDGFLIVGGPLGDGAHTLHLVRADSREQIERRMAGDPWATTDHLRIESIEPWSLWLDGARITP
jgi:uncharacterized protein YciI